jgi:ADP-heptose:LPS heptosyltransferase
VSDQAKKKTLIIRFSSIGDLAQTLSVASALKPSSSHLTLLTRADLAGLAENHPALDRVVLWPRRSTLTDFFKQVQQLRSEKFDRIYDAHNSLRSRLICWCLGFFSLQTKLIRKPRKSLLRFLLFRFRINFFEQPFSGQRDLLAPLKKWNLDSKPPETPQMFLSLDETQWAKQNLNLLESEIVIGLVPSAAFALKRWPLDYWKQLIEMFKISLGRAPKFILFGGPGDEKIKDLRLEWPEQILDRVGLLSLRESSALIKECHLVVSNDTGLMHIAEQLGIACIALMGPAPFGFPSRPATKILEKKMECRPCSKHGQGPCRNDRYQACLRDITPSEVFAACMKTLSPIGETQP